MPHPPRRHIRTGQVSADGASLRRHGGVRRAPEPNGSLLLRAHADVEGAPNHFGSARSAAILLPLRGVILGYFADLASHALQAHDAGKELIVRTVRMVT